MDTILLILLLLIFFSFIGLKFIFLSLKNIEIERHDFAIIYLGLCFRMRGYGVIYQHYFRPLTSSLFAPAFFEPSKVLNSSILGKALLIVIGQNSQ